MNWEFRQLDDKMKTKAKKRYFFIIPEIIKADPAKCIKKSKTCEDPGFLYCHVQYTPGQYLRMKRS